MVELKLKSNEIKISPSILTADFMNLGDVVKQLETSVDMLHFDVMDGLFVPNISIGLPVLKSVAAGTNLPLDVHLMIAKPQNYIENFANAGADIITIHFESNCDVSATLRQIKNCGKLAGLAINPGTDVEKTFQYLDEIDMLLIMSVEPGFGGQKFIENALEKIEKSRAEINRRSLNISIQVDGGINELWAQKVKTAGANIIVAGSYIINSANMQGAIQSLK